MKKLFLLATILLSLVACETKDKGYSVYVDNGIVDITMKAPSIGITGINKVSFDGFTIDDIEEEVFKKIRKSNYNGDYVVYVTMKYKDSYGNYYTSPEKVNTCLLNGKDVKKYADFRYFRGKLQIYKAYSKWGI